MLVINQSTYKKIFAVIAVAALFEPAYFEQASAPMIDTIYDLLKILCSLFILFKFICRQRVSRVFVLAVSFEGALLLSTLFMGGDILAFWKNSVYIVITAMLLEWVLTDDAPVMISALSLVFGIYSYISLLVFLLFPEGLYVHPVLGWKNCWFLGYKNIATPVLVLGVVCAIYDSLMRKDRMDLYALSVTVCSSAYMIGIGSVTGILALFITLCGIFLLFRIHILNRILTCKKIIIGNFILFVLLVFIRIQNILDLFGSFIVQVGKNITFSSRTSLWDRVIPLIQASFFWGHGVQTSEEYISISHYTWAFHLHSYYLQVLFEGGAIAFVLFFAFLVIAGMHFDRYSKMQACSVIKYGFAAYLLAIQMEAYRQISTLFIFVFLLWHIEEIEEQYEPLRLEYEMSVKKKYKFMWGKKPLRKEKLQMK